MQNRNVAIKPRLIKVLVPEQIVIIVQMYHDQQMKTSKCMQSMRAVGFHVCVRALVCTRIQYITVYMLSVQYLFAYLNMYTRHICVCAAGAP